MLSAEHGRDEEPCDARADCSILITRNCRHQLGAAMADDSFLSRANSTAVVLEIARWTAAECKY